jgi:hypothetical protein
VNLTGMFARSAAAAAAGGSYSGWDPADNSASWMTLSNGNFDVEAAVNGVNAAIRSMASKTVGDFYVEFLIVSGIQTDGQYGSVGILASPDSTGSYVGSYANSAGWFSDEGGTSVNIYKGSSPTNFPSTATFNEGHHVGLAVKMRTSGVTDVWFRGPSGAWVGGGNPATGATPTITLPAGRTYRLGCTPWTKTPVVTKIRLLTPPDHAMATPSGFTAGWPD